MKQAEGRHTYAKANQSNKKKTKKARVRVLARQKLGHDFPWATYVLVEKERVRENKRCQWIMQVSCKGVTGLVFSSIFPKACLDEPAFSLTIVQNCPGKVCVYSVVHVTTPGKTESTQLNMSVRWSFRGQVAAAGTRFTCARCRLVYIF